MAQSGVYANAIKAAFDGDLDWTDSATTWKAMLVQDTATYTADLDSHDFYNDVSTKAATGADDVTLATTRRTLLTASGNYIDLQLSTAPASDTITFTTVTSSTNQCYGIIVYKSTGTASNSTLLCYNEFTTPVTPNGSDIQVNVNAAGLVRFTANAS